MYKDNQERIDSYLHDEMSSYERLEFESDLKKDSILYANFLETTVISEALADRAEKLLLMSKWEAEENCRNKIERKKRAIRKWTMGISAAACVAICFFVVKSLVISPSKYEPFAMPKFSQLDINIIEGSGIGVLDSMIVNQDYTGALAFADLLIAENKQRIIDINTAHTNIKDGYEIITYNQQDSTSVHNAKQKQYEELIYLIEWRRINLLLALGKMEDLEMEINIFSSKDGIYKTQADSLMRTVKKTINHE